MILSDRINFYLDNLSPRITRSISTGNKGSFDVTDQHTFFLKVRPTWSSSVVLDEEMSKDIDTDIIWYSPQAGDFAVEGIYRAWVTMLTAGASPQDLPEFEIAVLAHAPGEGTRVGAVWRACRALSPVAWDSLRGHPEYGDVELQRIIELAKLRVLKVSVAAVAEDMIDLRVTDYIAKKVLVGNALPAVIDYWTNKVVSQSSQGNSAEVKTYPDRIRAIEEQIKRFRADLEEQLPEVEEIIGAVGTSARAPVLLFGGPILTPPPDCIPGIDLTRRETEWWLAS